MPFWRATVCRSLICQSSWARRMAARSLVAVFIRHDTTGEIAARRELPSLVQILSTSRRTTGLKVDRSITRKIASGCNESISHARRSNSSDREVSGVNRRGPALSTPCVAVADALVPQSHGCQWGDLEHPLSLDVRSRSATARSSRVSVARGQRRSSRRHSAPIRAQRNIRAAAQFPPAQIQIGAATRVSPALRGGARRPPPAGCRRHAG